MSEEYIPVKKSQLSLFLMTPLYYFSKDGEALLYKERGTRLDNARIWLNRYPELFIRKSDKKSALKEVGKFLNSSLASAISSKGFVAMKSVLCEIVEEALTAPLEYSFDMFPETVEILFKGYSENKVLLESLTRIGQSSSVLIDHTVNTLCLTMQYCFFHGCPRSYTRQVGVCAVLHDIGHIETEQEILESDKQLTDSEFEDFKTHTFKGYKMIRTGSNFEKEVAMVALEHHEKLDGSGYPRGTIWISELAQLIGLIDCYEPLTYRSKNFREAQPPYNSLQILKKDVVAGQYDKDLFKNLCACLTS